MPTQPVNFDGSTSTGDIAFYVWDFGDGTLFADTQPLVGHEYALGGTYTVRLTVFGYFGGIDYVEHSVHVRSFECINYDFTIDEQGFEPYVNVAAEDAAVYVPGVGWQNNPASVVSRGICAIIQNLVTPLDFFSGFMAYSHTADYPVSSSTGIVIYPTVITPPNFPSGGASINNSAPESPGDHTFFALFSPSDINTLGIFVHSGNALAPDTITISSIELCYWTSP